MFEGQTVVETPPIEKMPALFPQAEHKKRRQSQRPAILVIDDDEESICTLHSVFSQLGCNVLASGPDQAQLSRALKTPFDLMLVDCAVRDGILKTIQTSVHLKDGCRHQDRRRVGIVTFSRHACIDMTWPFCEHFSPLAHWRKPWKPENLCTLALQALAALRK